MKPKLFLLFFIAFPAYAYAQTKTTSQVQQLWFGYFNQSRLCHKWELSADIHLRTKEDFVSGFSQSIIRMGISYFINDAVKLTAGYAFVNYFPGDNHKNISQPERRPWQQLQWQTKQGKNIMLQKIRVEERYRQKILNDSTLADGYNFNWRLRYNILLEIPLNKQQATLNRFSFIANEEVNVNLGKQIVYNYFDQNRFFLGLKYHINEHNNLQFGYMNIFQQLAAGNKYKVTNAIRIFYFRNFDLRKKKIS